MRSHCLQLWPKIELILRHAGTSYRRKFLYKCIVFVAVGGRFIHNRCNICWFCLPSSLTGFLKCPTLFHKFSNTSNNLTSLHWNVFYTCSYWNQEILHLLNWFQNKILIPTNILFLWNKIIHLIIENETISECSYLIILFYKIHQVHL